MPPRRASSHFPPRETEAGQAWLGKEGLTLPGLALGGGPGTSHICHITSWAGHFSWAPASSRRTGCRTSCTWGWGTKLTSGCTRGTETTLSNHFPKDGYFPFLIPHASYTGQSGDLHPNSLLRSADLIPQALHRGVPSSASLQSGVLWVLQEAQRRGPEGVEAKGQKSEAWSPSSEGPCGVGKFGKISAKAPPGLGPAPDIGRSKTKGKPGRETDGKALQRRKLGVGVTQQTERGALRFILDGSKWGSRMGRKNREDGRLLPRPPYL